MKSRLDDIHYFVDRVGARRAALFYLFLTALFSLFLILVGAFTELSRVSKVVSVAAGVGGITAFGYLWLVTLYRLKSNEPLLVLSSRGLFDNASGTRSGAGWIAWSEIADVRLSTYHGLPCVEVVPKNREQFLQRFGWVERVNRSARLGYPAVAIRGRLLSVEPAELAEQMRTYWRRATDE